MADSNANARATASAWNAPGGGYDKWKAGDPQREKDLPIGAPLPKGSTPGNYKPKDTTHPMLKMKKRKAPNGLQP